MSFWCKLGFHDWKFDIICLGICRHCGKTFFEKNPAASSGEENNGVDGK